MVPFILGFSLAAGNIQFIPKKTPETINKENLVKVLSYNVRLFDLYNWTENIESRKNIVGLIKTMDADIICLQEFYSSLGKGFNNVDTLLKYQDANFFHIEYTQMLYKRDFYGIATFSKYPIVNKGTLEFKKSLSNVCIFTDIKVNKDTIRVYNMHLQSFRFDKRDYEFIENLQNMDEIKDLREEEQLEGTKHILKRLKLGFKKRAAQTDLIAEHIKSSPYPVIVCGDFNDTPSSYVYRKIKGKLNDAFIESGRGFGTTYTGPFPEFRIDYILHDEYFDSYEYRTVRKKYSDHYPVSCYINLHPDK